MASAKLIQIITDIDMARCNSNWAVIPDLARKYKKYNPGGVVLEQILLVEATFIQTINDIRSTNRVNFENDCPYHVSIEYRLEPHYVKSYQDQLMAAIQLPDSTNTNKTEKEFAKIILARTYFECGEYQKALDIISKLSFEKDHVSQGYGLVLFLQARVIKAICLELTGNEADAIQSYQGVEELLTEYTDARYKSLIEWSEESLYRAILLGLREGSIITIPALLECMRQYQQITATQSPLWRIQKRMIITKLSLRYISSIYRENKYCLPSGSQPDDPYLERHMFIREQSQLHTIYERMLYTVTPLPKAGQVNTLVLDFIDQFAKDFELISTTAYDLRGFVEVLDRASQRTFNSPLITRHLFLALVRLGEIEEAEHALHSYLYIVGLVAYGWKENQREGQALATDKKGFCMPVPVSRPDIETTEATEQILPVRRESIVGDISKIKSLEKEEVEDTLQVLLTAIKMYCNDVSRSTDAVEIAEIAKEFYQKQNMRVRKSTLSNIGASVYRALGAAYGFLGRQTFDPDLRPIYYEKALSYLKYSLELNSDVWETYYQLALQQAEMHDINQAVQSITNAIQTNPSQILLWHLLTLLVSCPCQGDYQKALKTCNVGLEQFNLAGLDGESAFYGENYDTAEQYVMYQLTKTLLLAALYGPDSALLSSENLLVYFRMIAAPDPSTSSPSVYGGAHNDMVISGSLGNLSELQIVVNQKNRRQSISSSLIATQQQQQHYHHHHHISKINNMMSSVSTSRVGSSSHDNILTTYTNKTLVAGRARSASNLGSNNNSIISNNNNNNNSQLLTVPGSNNEVKKHHHHHLHSLNPFGSKSTRNKSILPQQTNYIYSQNAGIGDNFSIQSLPISSYDTKSIGTNSVASLHSITPSYISNQSILQPKNIPSKPSTRTILRKEKSSRILSDLWLLIAQLYIKLGKLDEAHKAVKEAEDANSTTNPRVWCILGQLLQTEGNIEQAQMAFHKALAIDPHDVLCRLWLAKSYAEQDSQDLAEGLLDVITKSNGWDCAEAWFQLGEVYKLTGRLDRTKDCLFYALELESTTAIQSFSILPSYI
ncbi:uncharacterized protein BX663DRAFT_511869 [Cokeromyces recurvatus]|uniref:uncharacterized protein n=1 Tax=Cokeromyces recurvatus TaxID=90255 RepID=UPI00221FB5DF|nr:uncharacterized protein BX663DRAFT_511869 [Cokeromyces recurvatus]KAI7902144.1 hypothetical protein BX663DRAFT_511869 [Cokeromyces recurvatus]